MAGSGLRLVGGGRSGGSVGKEPGSKLPSANGVLENIPDDEEEDFEAQEGSPRIERVKPRVIDASPDYNPKVDRGYQIGVRTWGAETVVKLKPHESLINKVARENNIDPNLIRGVITNERITRGRAGAAEAIVSDFSSGKEGTYGPAQLGLEAREHSNLTIEQAMTYEGAVIGAGNWLGVQRDTLVREQRIAKPTNGQIATRYNSGDANSGLVNKYGKRVEFLINNLYKD